METLKVLELYSGIGGMHCALKESGIPHEVLGAVDINNVANDIYKLNFPATKMMQRTIESLTLMELSKLAVDMVTMSPPCQPFTRVGLQKDAGDQRTKSFFHLLDLLPQLDSPPKYVLVENVKGFDTSVTRDALLETLNDAGYHIQEFLLTPLQFGVPNSRLRYYLLAKRKGLAFNFPCSNQIHKEIPACMENYLHHKVRDFDPGDSDDGRWDMSAYCTCLNQSYANERCPNCGKVRYIGDSSRQNKSNISFGSALQDSLEPLLCSHDFDSQVAPKGNLTMSHKHVVHTQPSGCKSNHDTSAQESDHMFNTEQSEIIHIDSANKQSACQAPNVSQTHDPDQAAYITYRSICRPVSDYLEQENEEHFEPYLIPEKFYKRFWVMDIIKPHARNSCCFTKRYAHHLEGSGSVIQMAKGDNVDLRAYKIQRLYVESVKEGVRSLKLRFFTPREIANVMCFPPWFEFPKELSTIQLYRVLGNSLNVHVVAVLMRLLTFGDF